MNAFDIKFGSKISLRGPETVRKTHTSSSSTSSTSTSTSSSRSSSSNSRSSSSRSRSRGNRSRSSSSRAREEREREGKRDRERERKGGGKQMVAFGRFSDWFLTLQRDSCQFDLKAKAEIPRCTSGSGGAVAAGVVVVLRVVANLVMRVRIHAWAHSISNLGAK